MYFDVNIDERYLECETVCPYVSEYSGICVNRVLEKFEEMRGYERGRPGMHEGRRVFERIEIPSSVAEKMEEIDIYKMKEADLFVVRLESDEGLGTAMRVNADMVTIDYTKKSYTLCVRDVMEAVKREIFFEIPLVGGLYGGEEKILWMGNVRRLLSVTGGRNVVMSSGARFMSEMRRPVDFLKILVVFGIGGNVGKTILLNSARLLRFCNMRRTPPPGTDM